MAFEGFYGYKNGYSISKTLKFELIPQGKTLEFINKKGLLTSDEKRATYYKDVKKLVDEYHKWFIEAALEGISIDWTELKSAIEQFQKDKDKDFLSKIQSAYRAKIRTVFEKGKYKNEFKNLLKSTTKDLIKNNLSAFIEKFPESYENNKQALKEFEKFYTYFTGFQENRKNVYSKEAVSTSVTYRIVHDNFPKFLQNINSFEILASESPEILEEAQDELKPILQNHNLNDIFKLENFNKVLQQSGIDFYNQIIGGKSEENGTKLRGLNEFINLYFQKHGKEEDFLKNHHKVKMVQLFKQIMSDRSTLSFIPEMFNSDDEVKSSILIFWNEEIVKFSFEGTQIDILEEMDKLIVNFNSFEKEKIYIDSKHLTFVSQVLLGSWDSLQNRIDTFAENNIVKKERKKYIKQKFFSIAEINKLLNYSCDDFESTNCAFEQYFETRYKGLNKIDVSYLSISALIAQIKSSFESIKELLTTSSETPLREDEKSVEKIKSFLDFIQELVHRLKPLFVNNDLDKSPDFYNTFEVLYLQLEKIIPLYNKIRNYITKKAFDTGKFKLNFENTTLANGWDVNKEKDNTTVIFVKDDMYYLGIMNEDSKTDFSSLATKNSEEECYQKVVYKYFKDVTTMIPKCSTQRKAVKAHFKIKFTDYILNDKKNFVKDLIISKEIFDLNNVLYDGFKKIQVGYLKNTNDNEGFKKAIKTWINFCLDFLSSYKSTLIYDISSIRDKATSYNQLDEFYSDVNLLLYNLSFTQIPKSKIDELVESGKLYLFQIYNKDFAPGAKGAPNLHTLYWKNLFSKENLEDVVLKLNGKAELFYRKASIKKPIIHEVGSKIVNKITKDGKPIPEKIHTEIYNFENGKTSELTQDAKIFMQENQIEIKTCDRRLVKDKHYTQDKFVFHVPITINFKAGGNSFINEKVRKYLKENEDINIIGLDRGERHLLYLSVIDKNGKILEQKTFNQIEYAQKDKKVKIDYHEKLDQKEKERDLARKNWKTIGKIAELKEGYLSAVIHELATMMLKYNAIIVLEDLNFGFKRGRFHVEKQVYQKFEKMLIDKLNYLTLKDICITEPGGILNGYQLTPQFKSFQDLKKQTGFLFYVPAGYTSKIDPQTGFVNLFDLKNFTNVEKKKSFFEKFDSIIYDEKNGFAFKFDYKNFGGKASKEMHKTCWTVYSKDKRIKYLPKEKKYENVEPTAELKELFDSKAINFENGKNILPELLKIEAEKSNATFFDSLYRNFVLILQMRNSNAQTGEDYIISPVMNANGEFFDSRIEEAKVNPTLPKDADANGAYHIAKKGLLLVNRIKQTDENELKKLNLAISNKDWFEFVQK